MYGFNHIKRREPYLCVGLGRYIHRHRTAHRPRAVGRRRREPGAGRMAGRRGARGGGGRRGAWRGREGPASRVSRFFILSG